MARLLVDSNGSIGSFEQSMLTEVQYQALYGSGWIITDGRSVTGSKYHILTGNTNVPDFRGLVIRGKNNGRSDGNQNPDGELALGQFQDHLFTQHDHGGGSHSHNGNTSGEITNGHRINYGEPFGINGYQGGASYPDSNVSNSLNHTHSFTTNGPNSTVLILQGGNETRMRNVTMNSFIRIN